MQLSLAGKINLVIGALTAFTATALGILLFSLLQEGKERALVQRGAEIAEIIGDSSRRAAYTGNRDAARTGLAARRDVAYARILAADGTTLAAQVVLNEHERLRVVCRCLISSAIPTACRIRWMSCAACRLVAARRCPGVSRISVS